MIQQILSTNETLSSNHREMEILRRYFPQCFTNEGSFDIDLFKAQIQEKVNITHEGYDLNFLGKTYAKLLSSMDTTTVIVPDEAHNGLPENADSQNLYISGDNLDGLKHLLKSYAGQVKCIYIDPPYNTGTDGFVYNDKFTFTAEELSIKLSIGEEQAAKILDLTRRGSASHSAWLTFMACRLQLARDLLTDDGVIFISIDDNEQANLKLLCDSVFGEENFVAQFIWKKKQGGGNDSNHVVVEHEYIVSFAKEINNLELYLDKKYKLSDSLYPNKDEKGEYGLITLDKTSIQFSQSLVFEIIGPDGTKYLPRVVNGKQSCWRWSKAKVENEYADLIFKNNKVYTKYYRPEGITPKSLLVDSIYGRTESGNDDINELFDIKPFSYPKPVQLLNHFVAISTQNTDIILDFFSGSATTAQAVMQLNAEDGGNRRYIMVQLPEETPENSEARRAGYETIDQIGQERIRRAAAKIKEETGADIDYGFKHYTLAEPDDNTLDKMEDFNPKAIFADETLLDKFGKSSVLETWLVRDGYGFGADIKPLKLNNYTAYHIDKHLYLIDIEFDENDMVALIDRYSEDASFCPENIVLFGYSFTFTQTEMLRKNLVILRDGDKNLRINMDVRY